MRVLKNPSQAAEVHWLSEQFWSYQKQDKGPGQKPFLLCGGMEVGVSFSTMRSPVAVLRAQCNPTVLFLGYTQAKDKAPESLPTTSHTYPVCFYPRELPKQNTAADLRSPDKSHGEEAFSSTTFLTTGLAFS